MLRCRFPLFLVVSITGLSLNSINSSYLALETNYLVASQTNEEIAYNQDNKITAEVWNYQTLIEAGKIAEKARDYLTALEKFQKASTLRPDDSFAKTAIVNVSKYAFDAYMQAGYAADKIRDYQAALANFQKAKEIRPDSFYAQQAVDNVSHYLIAQVKQAELANQAAQNQKKLRNNILLLLLVLITAIGIVVGVFLLLIRRTNLPEEDMILETNTKSSNSQEQEQASAINTNQETTYSVPVVPEVTQIDHNPSPNYNSSVPAAGENSPPINPISINESNLVSTSSQISRLDIVPELIRDLQQSDRALRRKTIWELAQRADSRAMKPLVELMIEADSQERSLILEAMTQIASRTLKPMNQAIMLSLQDDNSQVRQNAIRDLTRVYELMSQVTKRLSLAVEDSDAEVKETAKWALNQLNQVSHIPFDLGE
jgi:tetratricopeptide (TPR) repeat protein